MNARGLVFKGLAVVLGWVTTVAVIRQITFASAAPAPAAPKSMPAFDAVAPTTSLKGSPRLARIRVDVTPGGAMVTHEMVFSRDTLVAAGATPAARALDPIAYVAFPAQLRPLAIQASVHSLDVTGAFVDATAEMVPLAEANAKPKTAALLLGSAMSAGHVFRIPHADRAFGLRFRTAIVTTDDAHARQVSLMIRLGVRDGLPMPLDRLEVTGMLGVVVRGARATLCGKASDPRPVDVVFPGYPPPSDAGTSPLSVVPRRPDDDLCLDVLI